jgi:hypothetical protein
MPIFLCIQGTVCKYNDDDARMVSCACVGRRYIYVYIYSFVPTCTHDQNTGGVCDVRIAHLQDKFGH